MIPIAETITQAHLEEVRMLLESEAFVFLSNQCESLVFKEHNKGNETYNPAGFAPI